ncbi:MAG: PIN domain-containing protein [Candidatus Acidiferrales bacterium]
MVIDTSVLVAGISGFREPFVQGRNPSSDVLHRWAEKSHFVWLITDDIVDEYKEVLKRLRVRPNLIGRVVNLIRERAEEIQVRPSIESRLTPKTIRSAFVPSKAKPTSSSPSIRRISLRNILKQGLFALASFQCKRVPNEVSSLVWQEVQVEDHTSGTRRISPAASQGETGFRKPCPGSDRLFCRGSSYRPIIPAIHGPDEWYKTRSLRDRRGDWRGRHGRSVSRTGHAARA